MPRAHNVSADCGVNRVIPITKYRLMMPVLKTTMATVAFVCTGTASLWAQLPSSPYEIGIRAGLFIYQGDLTPERAGSFKTPSFVFGINAARNLSRVLAVRLDLNRGSLRGNDAAYAQPDWRRQRNFNFSTPVTELSALLVWSAWGRSRRLSPYVFAGAGLALLRIRRDASNLNDAYFAGEGLSERVALDEAHRTPRVLPVVPAGIGLRYALTSHVSLNTEAAYRYTSTDYLDGFSQAANPSRPDHYYQYSVGATYSFGERNRLGCPVFHY